MKQHLLAFGEAEKNCPVARILNATITLDAKVIQ
jgi:organic hydroperoxide reductase OsmC/OhrA